MKKCTSLQHLIFSGICINFTETMNGKSFNKKRDFEALSRKETVKINSKMLLKKFLIFVVCQLFQIVFNACNLFH